MYRNRKDERKEEQGYKYLVMNERLNKGWRKGERDREKERGKGPRKKERRKRRIRKTVYNLECFLAHADKSHLS